MAGDYALGDPLSHYRGGEACHLTLIVTQDCNLRCTYCYEVGKNSKNTMSKEVAFKTIDYVLSLPYSGGAIVIEFMGGECTLEMNLIRTITEYFQDETFRKGHSWAHHFKFQLGTNGTLYHKRDVQKFIADYRNNVIVSMTIDGIKIKHDMNRKFPDGRGSYDIVEKNFKLWMRQFQGLVVPNTKITFSSEDLPYVCECIIKAWDLGIKEIAANAVFEDVWKPGDAELFESQLKELSERAVNEGYWKNCKTNLFWNPYSVGSKATEASAVSINRVSYLQECL